mmetsp:Transcript_293/g.324  ORF Transcript_293/g.324 Transcript_293/m.324 type:complete len:103 (+) Transcript_293:86-394(+)
MSTYFHKEKRMKLMNQMSVVASKYLAEWKKVEELPLHHGINKLMRDVISQCIFGSCDDQLVMDCRKFDGTLEKATLGEMIQRSFNGMIIRYSSPLRVFFNFF